MSRLVRHAASVALALVVIAAVAACSSGASSPTGPALSAGPDSPRIVAKDIKFTTPNVTVPADEAFALVFENQEAVPHNVAIQGSTGQQIMMGEVFTGPGERVYQVPSLAAGTYKFVCSVHPDMVGELTAQ